MDDTQNECGFCQLLQNKNQLFVIGENAGAIAFLDINPRSYGHTLVMPKQHISQLSDLSDTHATMQLISAVSERAYEKLNAQGVSVILNEGAAAGARIPHLAFQLFPRYAEESIQNAPAGAVFQPIEIDETELSSVWKKLRLDTAFLDQQNETVDSDTSDESADSNIVHETEHQEAPDTNTNTRQRKKTVRFR